MAILNIFKKPEKKLEKTEKKPAADLNLPEKKEGRLSDFSGILLSPHVTEKAAIFSENSNKYIFKVYSKSNKIDVKKAVETLYKVKVVGVRIINIPRKRIRVAGKMGIKQGYKKAIVELQEGQKIEIISR